VSDDALRDLIRAKQAAALAHARDLLHLPTPEPTDAADAALDPIRAAILAKQQAAVRRVRGDDEDDDQTPATLDENLRKLR
jgi:hypothetical protein